MPNLPPEGTYDPPSSFEWQVFGLLLSEASVQQLLEKFLRYNEDVLVLFK